MEVETVAVLKLEDGNPHDAMAVGVYVLNRKVGHLPRALARDFRDAIKRDGYGRWSEFLVDAIVFVPSESDENYSISVDLPVV